MFRRKELYPIILEGETEDNQHVIWKPIEELVQKGKLDAGCYIANGSFLWHVYCYKDDWAKINSFLKEYNAKLAEKPVCGIARRMILGNPFEQIIKMHPMRK